MKHQHYTLPDSIDWESKDGRLHGVIEGRGRATKLLMNQESQLTLARDNVRRMTKT